MFPGKQQLVDCFVTVELGERGTGKIQVHNFPGKIRIKNISFKRYTREIIFFFLRGGKAGDKDRVET